MTGKPSLVGNSRFISVETTPLFTPKDCDQLLSLCRSRWKSAGVTGRESGQSGSIQPEVRSVLTQPLPIDEDGHPMAALINAVAAINSEVFRFELTSFPDTDPPSVLRYESSVADHFHAHRDVGPDYPTRKLSCVVQLSDSNDYRGGSLVFPEEHFIAPTEQGTAIVFPSFLVHQVTPLVSGERYVLVAWAHGPTFA